VTELGIFNDEGMIDGPFYSREEADRVMTERYSAEDGEHVAECCHDHPENERATCEDCNAEIEDADNGGDADVEG
jgi:hypothetical protein